MLINNSSHPREVKYTIVCQKLIMDSDTTLVRNHKKIVMDYIMGRLKDFVKIILHNFQ